MENELFKLIEIDSLLRYPAGRTKRLIKQGKIQAITLPDGSLRVTAQELERLLKPEVSNEQA